MGIALTISSALIDDSILEAGSTGVVSPEREEIGNVEVAILAVGIILACLSQKKKKEKQERHQLEKKQQYRHSINIMRDSWEDDGVRYFKVIILGKSDVGKTAILVRFVDGYFKSHPPTICIDYKIKEFKHQGRSYHLELWDSAGQERYRTIIYKYFTRSKAAVLVFDLKNESSLVEVRSWFEQFVNHCGNEPPKILLANKSDLFKEDELEAQLERISPTIEKIKKDFDCQFFVVSALTGENINLAFNCLVEKIMKKHKEDISDDASIPLKRQKPKKSKCC